MFWSDVTVDTISRAKLDGSEVTVLVNSGLSGVGKSGRSPKQLYSLQYNVFTKYVPTYECIHKNTWAAFLSCAGMMNYQKPIEWCQIGFLEMKSKSFSLVQSVFQKTCMTTFLAPLPSLRNKGIFRCAESKQPKLLPEMLLNRFSEKRD